MTSVMTAKAPVLAPPAQPPRYSLLTCATLLTDDVRWQGGVQWAPEQDLGGGLTVLDCYGQTSTLGQKTNVPNSKGDPFLVWAEDHCSTFGFQVRDYMGRARRQLEATQSYRIANELWLGTQAKAAPLDNEWFTHNPEILASGTQLAEDQAIALIDEGAGQMFGGRRAMIHVSPRILDLHQNNLNLSGQLWTTALGSIVVADAGYPGTGPDGNGSTNQWIYATSMISYRLSDVEVLDPMVDKAVNDMKTTAERLALLQWDSSVPVGNHSHKGVLAVETNIPAFAFAA